MLLLRQTTMRLSNSDNFGGPVVFAKTQKKNLICHSVTVSVQQCDTWSPPHALDSRRFQFQMLREMMLQQLEPHKSREKFEIFHCSCETSDNLLSLNYNERAMAQSKFQERWEFLKKKQDSSSNQFAFFFQVEIAALHRADGFSLISQWKFVIFSTKGAIFEGLNKRTASNMMIGRALSAPCWGEEGIA